MRWTGMEGKDDSERERLSQYRKNSFSQQFEMQWTEDDPITGDGFQGGIFHATDPLGGLVPGFAFFTPDMSYTDLLGERTSFTSDSDPFALGSGCTLDGVPIDCNLAISMANNGAASVAPLRSATGSCLSGTRGTSLLAVVCRWI